VKTDQGVGYNAMVRIERRFLEDGSCFGHVRVPQSFNRVGANAGILILHLPIDLVFVRAESTQEFDGTGFDTLIALLNEFSEPWE
jgi:hypothetical protein